SDLDRRLAALARLPRRELWNLPDPRLEVLRQAVERGRSVRIGIDEPLSGDRSPRGEPRLRDRGAL
uniref:Vms1/Ankzf1 family peptidyl-tRNA hydrolase n=1 Tax=Segeticoccus rhizosphaerae TaxID=1104777 RepID=UPI0023B0BCF6